MTLAGAIPSVGRVSHVSQSIRGAAARTGVDFDYLMKTAVRESGLKTSVKAKTSSATGLFQFIDQTWLGTLKKHGKGLGYGRQAAVVETDARGRHFVSDKALREEIFALRTDAAASSLMAAALTRDAAAHLEQVLGRKPSQGELYISHFMGQNGAVRFLRAVEESPDEPAASLFAREARANRPVFFEKSGAPRSLARVYEALVTSHEKAVPREGNHAGGSSGADNAPTSQRDAGGRGHYFVPGFATGFVPGARPYHSPQGVSGQGTPVIKGMSVRRMNDQESVHQKTARQDSAAQGNSMARQGGAGGTFSPAVLELLSTIERASGASSRVMARAAYALPPSLRAWLHT